MIKCSFNYDENLLNKINKTTLKTSNLINEILIGLIFIAVLVMFAMNNYMSGAIFAVVGLMMFTGVIFLNKSISASNNMLLGQHVDVKFNENDMVMTCKMGEHNLYTAKFEYSAVVKVVEKNGLAYLYFNKKSVVILPKSAFKTDNDYKTIIERAGNNYLV